MNLALYLSRRIVGHQKGRFSSFIIRIAVASVALSVAVMLVATSLIMGFQHEIKSKMFGLWGHIHITHSGVFNVMEAKPISMRQDFYPSLDTIRRMYFEPGAYQWSDNLKGLSQTHAGIANIQAFVTKPGIMQAKGELEGIVVKGVGQNHNWQYLSSNLVAGQLPQIHTDSSSSRDILISSYTAARLRLEVGDRLKVTFVENGRQRPRAFKVSGLYSSGMEDYDSKFAFADLRVLQQVYGWEEDQVAGFEVFTEDLRDIDAAKEYLLYEVLPPELYAATVRERHPATFDWLDLQDTNKSVILLLMILVSIVNMSTALLILILERTHMIGLLKAMGSKNWVIQQVFLYNAAYIIIWGLLIGNFIGLGLMFLQDVFHFVKLNEADYYISYAPVAWHLPSILLINVGTLIITLISLLLPSLAVSAIRPLRALRLR